MLATDARIWIRALAVPVVRRRAIQVGAIVGVAQVLVNQGDVWLTHVLRHEPIAASLVMKTLLSPLLALSVAWISAAWAWVDMEKERQGSERI